MYDGILLLGFGGPTQREEVRPFLETVLRNRKVPPGRIDEVEHHYEVCGGYSPFNELTIRQAEALKVKLEKSGHSVPVYVGMRNWHPFIADVLQEMSEQGIRNVLGVIMAPHRAKASWEAYQASVREGLQPLREAAPQVSYLDEWHDDPLFIEAAADRVREVMDTLDPTRRQKALLVFTAHSIPTGMAKLSRYEEEFQESSAAVAESLGVKEWTMGYQSRSGNPSEPWLEPDVEEVIREAAEQGVKDIVLVPIGFLCDHMEVLFDLDVEAVEIAQEVGVELRRAETVGEHPKFIQLIAEKILRASNASVEGGKDRLKGPPL